MEVVLDGEDTETAGGRRSGQPTSGASSADANGGVGTEGEASGSGGSGDDDSGEEYDPIAKRASATSSSSSGSSGSEDEALNMQQKEQVGRPCCQLGCCVPLRTAAYRCILARPALIL